MMDIKQVIMPGIKLGKPFSPDGTNWYFYDKGLPGFEESIVVVGPFPSSVAAFRSIKLNGVDKKTMITWEEAMGGRNSTG